MNFFSTNKKLGILGGGQLGKMLLYSTRKWDIRTFVLDPNYEAPAKLACDVFIQGDLTDYQTVLDFGKKVDILTIEIENINIKALYKLKKEGVKIFPQPEIIEIIQNKSSQKEFYIKNNIPTSNYKSFSNLETLKNAIAKGSLSFPFVWKASEMGYDGYGVSVIKKNKDLENLLDCDCIAEDFVPFKNELSVIIARREQGETKAYPVVEMEFHPTANQVEYVICPARISSEIKLRAKKIALEVSKKYKHIGLLAVEMFLTETGEILVNEVAPRPHNSGHLTIESSYTNQFEQHIRAILNLPLGDSGNKVSGVMVNLVGKENHNGPVVYKNIDQILAINGVTPHIYGKKQTRPFRKMGHVSIVNKSLDKARQIAEEVKSIIEVISE
ncbi:MAG: 5-(carboxyamino)imidazole ribonucleotide synthase [Candidatus Marivariicella framensis]|mgnify:FL=1|jgi:5-(carboxyamino)imidazole ribonucleotide synthase|tara:strand:+ start:12868 stop:14022 length:1155 start_codon:yes stop_codon:yes gene_type:complete